MLGISGVGGIEKSTVAAASASTGWLPWMTTRVRPPPQDAAGQRDPKRKNFLPPEVGFQADPCSLSLTSNIPRGQATAAGACWTARHRPYIET